MISTTVCSWKWLGGHSSYQSNILKKIYTGTKWLRCLHERGSGNNFRVPTRPADYTKLHISCSIFGYVNRAYQTNNYDCVLFTFIRSSTRSVTRHQSTQRYLILYTQHFLCVVFSKVHLGLLLIAFRGVLVNVTRVICSPLCSTLSRLKQQINEEASGITMSRFTLGRLERTKSFELTKSMSN